VIGFEGVTEGLSAALSGAAEAASSVVGWSSGRVETKSAQGNGVQSHQKPPTPDWNASKAEERAGGRRESGGAYERAGAETVGKEFGDGKREMNLGNKYATSYSWDNPPPKPRGSDDDDDDGEGGREKTASELFGMDKEPSKKMLKKRAARAKESGAMHAAVANGDFADVHELLELGANANEAKSAEDTTTPLLVAAAKGHADIAKLLLKNGASLSATDDCGNTALHIACSKGHVNVVGRLIKAECDLSVKAGNGATALHLAARKGHDDVVALLIESGCDIECVDAKGATPLHAACSGGYEDTVMLLLKRGANPNAVDAKGKTPRQIASKKGNDDCAKVIKRAMKETEANAAAVKHMAEEREKRAVLKARAEEEAQLAAQGLSNIHVVAVPAPESPPLADAPANDDDDKEEAPEPASEPDAAEEPTLRT